MGVVLSLWGRQCGGGDDCLRPPGHSVFGGKERRRASRGRSTCCKVADPAAQFQRRLPQHPGYGRGSGEPLQLRSPGVPEDSSGTFVREKAVDAEEAIDGRQIIDSAAGALAPKLFSAAAGAGIALMALV